MVDYCYYNLQIKDELDGAADYIKRAINAKEKHPEWANLYAKMSEAELDHAKNLMQIYEDDLKTFKMEVGEENKADQFSSYLNSESMILHDMYTETVAKIKHMHDIYASK